MTLETAAEFILYDTIQWWNIRIRDYNPQLELKTLSTYIVDRCNKVLVSTLEFRTYGNLGFCKSRYLSVSETNGVITAIHFYCPGHHKSDEISKLNRIIKDLLIIYGHTGKIGGKDPKILPKNTVNNLSSLKDQIIKLDSFTFK